LEGRGKRSSETPLWKIVGKRRCRGGTVEGDEGEKSQGGLNHRSGLGEYGFATHASNPLDGNISVGTPTKSSDRAGRGGEGYRVKKAAQAGRRARRRQVDGIDNSRRGRGNSKKTGKLEQAGG